MLKFDAPLDFDVDVMQEYLDAFPIADNPEDVKVWVVDPKRNSVINGYRLAVFPSLKILATPSTGTNHIDLQACEWRGIKVLSLLDDRIGLDTISASAEFTFKLLIDALRKPPARELQGKTVGLVGWGRIGNKLHGWLYSFGAKVWICDPYALGKGHPAQTVEWLFENCDAVVVCCTYNKETHHMIGRDLLRSMRKGAALVNTSRGEVIDEFALAMVMEERPDLRVAVDVLEGEVTGTQNPQRLVSRGAIVTPHIAGETYDSRTKAARIILELLKKEMRHGRVGTAPVLQSARVSYLKEGIA